MEKLVDSLIKNGWLKNPLIIRAFREIKRVDFLPKNLGCYKKISGESQSLRELANLNEALPIGWGQTISQPLVVAFMLELLKPLPGDKILDIGSGSGWTTALLAFIAGKEGRVIAIERIPELVDFGRKNVSKYSFLKNKKLEFVLGNGSKGYPKEAPYDKILSSAMAQDKIPAAWKNQLKIGGRIVAPVNSSIFLFIKKSDKDFDKKEFPGFAFVPLIEN